MQYAQDGCLATVVDLSGDANTVISTGATLLMGIHVNVVMSAHAVTIDDGTTAVMTLAASTAAGTNINCFGTLFSGTLEVNPNNSSTGTITVFYRPI